MRTIFISTNPTTFLGKGNEPAHLILILDKEIDNTQIEVLKKVVLEKNIQGVSILGPQSSQLEEILDRVIIDQSLDVIRGGVVPTSTSTDLEELLEFSLATSVPADKKFPDYPSYFLLCSDIEALDRVRRVVDTVKKSYHLDLHIEQ